MKSAFCVLTQAYGGAARLGKAAALTLMVSAGVAAADPVKITALGDSLTQGYGLAQGDGFVPQLQAWLRARGADVTIINAGVSGDTTAGGAARVGWALGDKPDAVIVALGGNDVLRGLAPEQARANLDKILTATDGLPTLLIGIAAPGNYGMEYKRAFDAIYPALAKAHDVLLVPNMLAAVTDGPRLPREWMQADGIHPNATGVARIVEAIGPEVLKLLAEVRQGS